MMIDRQRGVALITVLLVVALAVSVAAAMASRQQLDIRRTGNLLHSEQAQAYVAGAESWSRVVLDRDLRDNKIDTLDEDWAKRLPPSIVEGGFITGCILDAQGRFNLNSLVAGGKPVKGAVDRYRRLLEALDLGTGLADTLVDWMDANIATQYPDGAEDDHYLLQKPSYRTSNQPLADLSELRLIKGYDGEAIAALLPHVSALPDPGAPLNVNTASAEVLLTVAENIPLSDAQKMVEARPPEGFATVADFLQADELAGKTPPPDEASLSVQSEWFVVLGTSRIGQGNAQLTALLHRDAQGTEVVQRRQAFGAGLVCEPAATE